MADEMGDPSGAQAGSVMGQAESTVRGTLAALGRGDLTAFGEFIAPDMVALFAGEPEPVRGRESYLQFAGYFLTAFPDLHATIHEMVECGGRVTTRLTYHGTHQGEFEGFAATGKRVDFDSVEMHRVADGQIIEEWVCFDAIGLLRQIGAVPPADTQ